MASVEEVSRKLESKLEEHINDLDKKYVRKLQRSMHLCAAKCCENTQSEMDSVQRCMDDCTSTVSKFQATVEQEISKFQSRVQRCAKDCEDNLSDKLGDKGQNKMTPGDIDRYKPELVQCFSKCADDSLNLLPGVFKRLNAAAETALKNSKF